MNWTPELIHNMLWAAAAFLAVILCLMAPVRIKKKLIVWTAIITVLIALPIYSYGYAVAQGVGIHAVCMAVFATLKVFGGSEKWGDVQTALTQSWMVALFWGAHLLGLFTSTSALLTAFSAAISRQVRLAGLRKKTLHLIYGLDENTLAFGQALVREKKGRVLFVDPAPDTLLAETVWRSGCALRTEPDAVRPTVRLLQKLNLKKGKRRLYVYALRKSRMENQMYAQDLLIALEKRGILPRQTQLTLIDECEETENRLQATATRYGYGNVLPVDEPELVGRLLMQLYPPCKQLEFDETGVARQDMHALIIGFGRVGQSVLKHLVMNGQFLGSRFRAAVFDPNYQENAGRLTHECRPMLDAYKIRFFGGDGRGDALYDYIAQYGDRLRYVAVCVGKNAVSQEIADQLQAFLRHKGCQAPIYLCSRQGVAHRTADRLEMHPIYTPMLLCDRRMDLMAMAVNHFYANNSSSILSNWQECDFFSRMSSRASADFQDAILHIAGITEEQARKGWKPDRALLENLAQTEHLRWVAFHYCMGFRTMTPEEFAQRAETYPKDKADPKYRITKDLSKRIHACLIPWEQLKEYSQKENKVTGGQKDYQQTDRNSILNIPAVLSVANLVEQS